MSEPEDTDDEVFTELHKTRREAVLGALRAAQRAGGGLTVHREFGDFEKHVDDPGCWCAPLVLGEAEVERVTIDQVMWRLEEAERRQ